MKRSIYRGAGEAPPTEGTDIMCESYNGYKNRETWAFMLYLNNSDGLLGDFRSYVRDHHEDRVNDEPQADWWAWGGADTIAKRWAETYLTPDGYAHEFGDEWPEALQEMATDIGSLFRVDWFTVLRHAFDED
jgi:FAD/FMN-containing dehydrogenase